MSGLKGVLKEGWHPKGKDGGKESWRGDFKGINQVAGWMGKGKDRDSPAVERVSRPLSSLKDPASFGPPPRHINSHGPTATMVPADRRGGLGASLNQAQVQEQNARLQPEEESNKPAPPPVPYRVDRTGLTTTNLPPPPVRRVNSPAASSGSAASTRPSASAGVTSKPNVPPRVPPRTSPATSQPQTPLSPPPPAYSTVTTAQSPSSSSEGYLNQNATSRLAQRGVSVPGLGIGGDGNSRVNGSSSGHAPVNELQSRFAQLSTSASPTLPARSSPPPATTGTTWAEKQAALRTAHNAHKDPSSVSLTEARSAASTLNNFRERHHDQIQAGMRKVNGLNEKYGISTKIKNFANGPPPGGSSSTTAAAAGPASASATATVAARASPPPLLPSHPGRFSPSSSTSNVGVDIDGLNRRKPPPPPPPPKRQEIRGGPSLATTAATTIPPPLPLGTKPR